MPGDQLHRDHFITKCAKQILERLGSKKPDVFGTKLLKGGSWPIQERGEVGHLRIHIAVRGQGLLDVLQSGTQVSHVLKDADNNRKIEAVRWKRVVGNRADIHPDVIKLLREAGA